MNTTRFFYTLSIWLFLGVSVYAQNLDRPASKPNTSVAISSQSSNPLDGNGVAAQQAANSLCLQSGNIDIFNVSADLPADEGPCFPDDTLIVCFQVQSYQQTDGNWLQAIVPEFEPCWYVARDPVTNEPLEYHVPPPVTADGQWQWFSDGEVLYNDIPNGSLPAGTPVGEGWFFTGQVPAIAPCFDPTDPNCTWGDETAGIAGTFEICIIASVICQDPSFDPQPCNLDFKTYSDSEVGAFENPGCQFDEEIEDAVLVTCCEDPTITNDTLSYTVCSGESANITLYSDMDPETTFSWTVLPEAYGATAGSGPVINDVYQNMTGSPVTVQYTVTPVCAGGCVGRDQYFIVTIFPDLQASISGNEILCPGDCAFLIAETSSDQAPFTYAWNIGSTDPELFCVGPGFYSVTITDVNGCSDDAAEWVEEVPETEVSIQVLGPTTLCPGESTTLLAEAFGGSGSYEYYWSTGESGSSITVNEPGNYLVQATDQGFGLCPGFASVSINASEEIDIDIATSGPSTLCTNGSSGQSVSLNAQASGGSGGFSYAWSNGDDGNTTDVDLPDTYSILVTDANGCTEQANIEIPGIDPPQLSLSPDGGNEICAETLGDGINVFPNVAGGSGDFEYEWTDGSSGSSAFVQTTSNIGLTLIDQQSGCIVTASPVALTIHPPINLSITPDSDTELCASGPDDGITLLASPSGGSGDYDFNWSNGDGGATAFVQQSGNVSLSIVDQQTGCIADADPVNLTIHPPLEIQLATDVGTEICATSLGEGITVWAAAIAGSGQYAYNWSAGDQGDYAFVDETTTISVEVVDQQTGCVGVSEPTELVIHPPVEVSIISDAPTELCADSDEWPIQLTAGIAGNPNSFDFEWSTGSNQSDISVDEGGAFTLIATDQASGCQGTAELNITRYELPAVSLSGPVDVCITDEQACLDVAPLGGSWSIPDVNGSCLDLADLAVGTHILDYTYTDENGCSGSAAHQLTTFAAPELPEVNCTATTANVIFDWSGPEGQTYAVNGDLVSTNTYQLSGLAPEQQVAIELVVSTAGPCMPITQVFQCETEACPPITLELTTDLSQPFCANDLPDQPIELGLQIIGDEEQIGSGSWTGIGLVDAEQGIIDLSDPAFGEGDYNYSYTYQIDNCTYTTSQTMRLAPPPEVDAGEDQIVGCNFEGLDLLGIASTGTQLAWLDASGQEIGSQLLQTIDQTGLYQLRATDLQSGCTSVDEIIVSRTENLPEELEIMAMPETCFGDGDSYIEIMDVFGGTAPYTFMLDQESASTSGRWDDLTADSYQITVIDDLGCELTTMVELPQTPPIEIDLADEVEMFFGEEYYIGLDLPLAENLSIQWFPQRGVECMDIACAEVVLNPLLSQVFTVEVQNERGCLVTEDISVIVRDGRAVYLPTAFSPNEDGNNDEFMIFPLQDEVRVSQSAIFDRWGNMVASSTSDQNDRHFIWDGRKSGELCSVGVYIYQVELTMPNGERELVTGEVTLVR